MTHSQTHYKIASIWRVIFGLQFHLWTMHCISSIWDLVYFGQKPRPWIMIYNQVFLLNEASLYETHSCIFFFMKWYKLYSLNHLFTKLNKILFITIVTIGFFLTIDNKVRIMFHCFHLHKRSRGSSMNRGTRGGD